MIGGKKNLPNRGKVGEKALKIMEAFKMTVLKK
jgi:hypothetical protein